MSSWVGYGVSVNCGEPLGYYQGTILEANGTTITLTKAFRNGFPYPKSQVTLNAADIKDLKIIESKTDANEKTHSTIAVQKPQKKAQNRPVTSETLPNNSVYSTSNGSTSSVGPNTGASCSNITPVGLIPPQVRTQPISNTNGYNGTFSKANYQQQSQANFQQQSQGNFQQQNQGNFQQQSQTIPINGSAQNHVISNNAKSKPIDIQNKQNRTTSGMPNILGTTPNKKEKQRKRNEVCFGTPSDDPLMNEEFDFEKNLALFDKKGLWQELNHSHRPDVVRQVEQARHYQQRKYRHDENILSSQPATYRPISVPDSGRGPREYVTDEGLVVPSVTVLLRSRILESVVRAGLEGGAFELLARAACDTALRLVGGGRRLTPRNAHQAPAVVLLVAPHEEGKVGIMTARHLASHGVETVLLVCGEDRHGMLQPHLRHYELTGNKLTNRIEDLPSADLIIAALHTYGYEEHPVPKPLSDWISQSRAPVLALDPPASGTPNVAAKFSLLSMLPLSHSEENGQLYLCNVAIPDGIFTNLGIQYKSPFGAKSVIPLHPNEDS